MWDPQVEGLRDRMRVIVLDLPGYGESPLRADPMPMRGFAESVVDVLDRLKIESAVIVGLSMGGLVAMELGLGFPERVDALALVATTAEPVLPGEVDARYARAALAERDGMAPLAEEMISGLLGPSATADDELVASIYEMMMATPPSGAAAALRGRAARRNYAADLHAIDVPTLVVTGGLDIHAPPHVNEQLLRALAEPQHVHFEESGHMPNLEEPERFNELIAAFVADGHA